MTKGLKTLTLDIEVIEKLKEEKNQSALINSYLRHFYNLNIKENEKQNN